MTTPRYVRMPDGRLVAVPTPVTPPEPVEEAEPEEEEEEEEEEEKPEYPETEISEEAMDDLFGVSEEDIMGPKPKPKKPKPRLRRTIRPYYPPGPSIISPG